MEAPVDLTRLDGEDLGQLRLGARVLRYKAALADRPRVAGFFEALADAAEAEGARRRTHAASAPTALPLPADPDASPDEVASDRALVAEYLALLRDNMALSDAIRGFCGVLAGTLQEATGRAHRAQQREERDLQSMWHDGGEPPAAHDE